MLVKITTSLGYSLLTAAAIGGALYSSSSINFAEIAQFAVLAAGAIALLLITRTRSDQ